MMRYLTQRLLTAVPTLLIIATLAFALLHATPGGPFDSAKRIPPEIERSIEAQYHLDEPLWRQYLRYMGNLARGDLGPSYQYRDTSVNELIRQGLPVDATIGTCALLLALLIGTLFGLIAALRRDTTWDYVPMLFASLGIALPVFVVGPLLILVFAVTLHWLPSGDWRSGSVRYLMLPVIALALPYMAYMARMVRGAALEVLTSPFIRTARAKGLPLRTVILRHALRPILTPARVLPRPGLRGRAHGLDHHRVRVRSARHRALLPHRSDQSRLHPGDWHHRALWRADHRLQPARRSLLCMDRSPSAIGLVNGAAVGKLEGESPWRRAWLRLRRRPAALVALAVLGAVALLCLLVPLLSPFNYATPDWNALYESPGWPHLFGTDDSAAICWCASCGAAACRC